MRVRAVASHQVGKHRKGCHALASYERGDWFTPWSLPMREEPTTWGTAKGNTDSDVSRRNHLFVQFCCNDIQCPARLLVSNDAILQMVEDSQ
jgi:hypothetical protein